MSGKLSAEQIAAFQDDGYLIVPGLFDREEAKILHVAAKADNAADHARTTVVDNGPQISQIQQPTPAPNVTETFFDTGDARNLHGTYVMCSAGSRRSPPPAMCLFYPSCPCCFARWCVCEAQLADADAGSALEARPESCSQELH